MKASKNAERVADTAKHRALHFVCFTKAVGLLLLLAFFVAACSKSEDAGVPLLDSGVFGFDSEPTYWIDDHRVMFVGWLGSKADAHQQDSDFPRKHLLIWDTNSGEVTVYREDAWNLCFYDGFISYLTGDPSLAAISRRKLMTGQFGKETVTQSKPITKDNKWFRRKSKIDCRVWDAPGFLGDSDWKPLIYAHGLVDRGPWPAGSRNHPGAYLVNWEGTTRHKLPMRPHQVSRVNFYPFKGQYLIQPFSGGFRSEHIDNNCWPYWWLDPSGTSTEECLPFGPWGGKASMWVVGTLMGPVVMTHNINGNRNLGDAGAYLIQADHSYVKLAAGFVLSPSVSGDGCRLAFLHAPGPSPRAEETNYWISLKSVNVCPVGS